MRIRQLDDKQRQALGLPLQTYAFRASPSGTGVDDYLRGLQPYLQDNLTLAVEDGDRIIAQASAIPMRQNLRGGIYPMAGIAGVASHPLSRGRGNVRLLLTELLGRMRDTGHALSALHPFRPSFYQRFGYVGLPRPRTVRFAPSDLTALVKYDLPGEVTLVSIADGYDAYCDFLDTVLARQHGFALLPKGRMRQRADHNDRWLAIARDGDEAIGLTTYRITHFAGELISDELLVKNALGRALLLQFFAHHRDQVATVTTRVGPAEIPEVWLTDLQVVIETAVALPQSPPPMARVLSLDALSGMAVGPGRVVVEVVNDPFLSGPYLLDGSAGALEVSRSTGTAPAAVLSAAGFSGLLYGILRCEDVVIHGLGTIPEEAATQLDALFPRAVPYLSVEF